MTFAERFPSFDDFEKFVTDNHDDIINGVRWTTGGLTGGSCWDSGPGSHYPVEAEEEPEIEQLDDLLEAVFPDLRYLEYRRLMNAGITIRTEGSYSEYYGNYTTWATKQIDLSKLYDALMALRT